MGLARLATRRAFTDVTAPGDRALAIFISRGNYHFATYSGTVPNLP
jgi:hypothetical protein